MYFTQEDYKKIEDHLKARTIKDTQFPEAEPVDGSEDIPIIQGGKNKIVNIDEFTNQVGSHPDNEDIVGIKEGKKTILKFKDREYKPEEFSGMGMVILRKNIVKDGTSSRNILTQDMVNKENTLYIIRYDFDLSRQLVFIPKGCTLWFQGGTINNGVFQLNETAILGAISFEDMGTAMPIGTFNTGQVMLFSNDNYQSKVADYFEHIKKPSSAPEVSKDTEDFYAESTDAYNTQQRQELKWWNGSEWILLLDITDYNELKGIIDDLIKKHNAEMSACYKYIKTELYEVNNKIEEANNRIDETNSELGPIKLQINLHNNSIYDINERLGNLLQSIGEAGGVAPLDNSAKVPAAYLPSYVDDVLEYNTKDSFPSTGESGKIYVALDSNLTYRWTGTAYVEISKSLGLGETSSTAYPGNKGKENADSLASHKANLNNPHEVTKTQIGLGNVDNTSDLDKPVSHAQEEALHNSLMDLGTCKDRDSILFLKEGGLWNWSRGSDLRFENMLLGEVFKIDIDSDYSHFGMVLSFGILQSEVIILDSNGYIYKLDIVSGTSVAESGTYTILSYPIDGSIWKKVNNLPTQVDNNLVVTHNNADKVGIQVLGRNLTDGSSTFNLQYIEAATKETAGVMSADDKKTLDDLKERVDYEDTYTLDTLSYGVEWKSNVSDPQLTRIGSMDYHRTLPIQSKMKGCIYNPKTKQVVYWLDENDWRFKEEKVEYSGTLGDGAIGPYFVFDDTSVISNLCKGQYVKIINKALGYDSIGKIIEIGNDSIVIEPEGSFLGGTTVEIGSRLDGYDGEVMVYVPKFYIKSWDGEKKKSVRISPVKIDDTWECQPALFMGAYRDTVLNTVPENMGYLSTLEANTAISVANNAAYCRGGNNDPTNDNDEDIFKRQLGKCRTSVGRSMFRTYIRKTGKEIMSYRQYKNILYWLWVIEYANFNSQAAFNSELTAEGFHQGGMGPGLTTVTNWQSYNNKYALSPNGYTNEFGNGTGVKLIAPLGPAPVGGVYTIRWRGIENPFGDVNHNLDGIIIRFNVSDNMDYVYTTDDPTKYGDILESVADMTFSGFKTRTAGYIKEWYLGSTAEIIPIQVGGNITQYKCDYYYSDNTNVNNGTLIVGGVAYSGDGAGLGHFYTDFDTAGFKSASSHIGFRSVSIV